MTVKIGWFNYADDAALSGGSWVVSLANLLDPAPKVRARSASALVTSTKFNVTLDAISPIELIALCSTNLSSAALYKITWYSDAFTTAVGDTGWLPIPGYPSYDYSERGVDVCHIFADAMSYRFFSIEIDDTLNADTYVEVGRLVMSRMWEPPYNYDTNRDAIIPNTLRNDALGGTGHFNRRPAPRALTISWPALNTSEEDELREFREYNGIDKQVFVVPMPDDATRYNLRNFLATLRVAPEFSFMDQALMTTSLDFLEAV